MSLKAIETHRGIQKCLRDSAREGRLHATQQSNLKTFFDLSDYMAQW